MQVSAIVIADLPLAGIKSERGAIRLPALPLNCDSIAKSLAGIKIAHRRNCGR